MRIKLFFKKSFKEKEVLVEIDQSMTTPLKNEEYDLILEKEKLLSTISMLEKQLIIRDQQIVIQEEESKQEMLDYAGRVVSNFTKYFSTEDCMTCLLDKEGKFLIYTRCETLDLKLTGQMIRRESPTYIETLGKGIPTITKVPAGTYGQGTPSFVFFAFPIHYKGELIGATGITIDMTNNELLPTIVAGIEEMRAASEELISTVSGMKEKLDMISQATENQQKRFVKLVSAMGELSAVREVIEDVSDSIDLLSLNSRIESARLGSAGRAFAVIADAITKVNEKTKESNKVSTIAADKVKEGLSEIAISMKMLEQVQDDMYNYNDMLSSMYEELSAQIESLNTSVSSINIGQEII